MLCETQLKQTALMQSQLMILLFQMQMWLEVEVCSSGFKVQLPLQFEAICINAELKGRKEREKIAGMKLLRKLVTMG